MSIVTDHGAPMIFHCSVTVKDRLYKKNYREMKIHPVPLCQSPEHKWFLALKSPTLACLLSSFAHLTAFVEHLSVLGY